MAVFAAIPMALVDIISYVVEYTGAAIGFQILGISPKVSVPFIFIAHVGRHRPPRGIHVLHLRCLQSEIHPRIRRSSHSHALDGGCLIHLGRCNRGRFPHRRRELLTEFFLLYQNPDRTIRIFPSPLISTFIRLYCDLARTPDACKFLCTLRFIFPFIEKNLRKINLGECGNQLVVPFLGNLLVRRKLVYEIFPRQE